MSATDDTAKMTPLARLERPTEPVPLEVEGFETELEIGSTADTFRVMAGLLALALLGLIVALCLAIL